MHGIFTWVDLSALHFDRAQTFYSTLFDWSWDRSDPNYLHALLDQKPVAGLFPMPDLFRKINMPSFWMSYLAVDNIQKTVALAEKLGAKIELQTTNSLGEIALIRDPAGAGFTCFQGNAPSALSNKPNHWCHNQLLVSDLSKVRTFYESLFNWTFHPKDNDYYEIRNPSGQTIASAQVAPNDIKGEKEFWAVFFSVPALEPSLKKTQSLGGKILACYPSQNGEHVLIEDSQGAACYLTESNTSSPPTHTNSPLKWRTIVGLIAIFAAVILEANWIWAALFLFWIIPDLKSGTTHFIEPLTRRDNPILYWTVVVTWLTLSALMLFYR
ncbi:MAG: VOC family protein [Verrucomicrobiota bacterium]